MILPAADRVTSASGSILLLETDRLVLRRFTEDDVDHLYDLNGDPDVL